MSRFDWPDLRGMRIVLANPRLYPQDLRGETHAPDRRKSERAMNFGLLVLATALSRCGAHIAVHDQEDLEDPSDGATFRHLLDREDPHVVGVGIISSYAFLGAVELLSMAHERGITTMAGGQSAMAFGEELLADDSPCDFLFTGDGEEVVPSVLAQIREGRQPQAATGVSPRGATAPAPPAICSDVSFTAELEYELYPGWRSFFPLVEESRACPFNCAFCSNAPLTERRWRGKDPKIVLREVERVCRMWNRTDATPVVLQCANFGTDAAQAEELLAAVVRSPVNPRFLAALRVDSHWKKYLHLVGSTFDQVHFGLESGSPQQLLAMGKAKSPATYLDMAGEAFAAFHERGVHVGINFLLGYFGETYRTLGETFGFILRHSSAIDSAWGGPFVLYPDTPAWSQLPEFSEKCGSRTVETSSMCRRIRTYPVQPSQHLRHEDVAAASLLLMRMVNSRRGYYEHYRWYLGPDPSTDADFYSEERFFDLMFAHADPATLGVSLTP